MHVLVPGSRHLFIINNINNNNRVVAHYIVNNFLIRKVHIFQQKKLKFNKFEGYTLLILNNGTTKSGHMYMSHG